MDISKYKNKFGSFSLDGKEYNVCANFNDICDMEDIAGCNLLEAMSNIARTGTATAKQLRGLLAAMIVAPVTWPKEPSEQLKAAGQLIRFDTADPIATAIAEACYREISEELGDKFRASLSAVVAEPQTEEVPAPPVDGAPEVPVAAI
jgi:hypothetical protein